MKTKIAITEENVIYAYMEPEFTHDLAEVVEGSVLLNRHGEARKITKIDRDECGRRQFWSNDVCLTIQYGSGHNMLTKPPFYAHQFKIIKIT